MNNKKPSFWFTFISTHICAQSYVKSFCCYYSYDVALWVVQQHAKIVPITQKKNKLRLIFTRYKFYKKIFVTQGVWCTAIKTMELNCAYVHKICTLTNIQSHNDWFATSISLLFQCKSKNQIEMIQFVQFFKNVFNPIFILLCYSGQCAIKLSHCMYYIHNRKIYVFCLLN